MTFSNNSSLYGTLGNISSTQLNGAIRAARPPTDTDTRGPQGSFTIGQLWVDTVGESSFQLVNLAPSSGTIVASWIALGGGSTALGQLSGDSGVAFPLGGNINIIGGAGIVTSGASDNITIALTGGSAAIDSVAVQTGTSPVLPDAVGLLTLNGAVAAPGTHPVRTDGTGANTIAIEVQKSQAIASTDATKIGLSAFSSTAFAVDGNGFVTLPGGGEAIESITINGSTGPGTNPVLPNGIGKLFLYGTQVANGTNADALWTYSRAANTIEAQIQRTTTAVSADATKNGIAHFSSAEFSVDSNGFVTLVGGGEAIDSIAVQTGTSPIAPTGAGLVTINGAVVAAGTHPVRTDGTGANTMALEIQTSQAIGATDATKIGLCNFNSSDFTVDANGFVASIGGGFARQVGVDTFTGPGTNPVLPTAGGLITVTGAQIPAATTANVIRIDSLAANTYTVEIQRTSARSASAASFNGVSHFDSASFGVDSNGFVTLLGGGEAVNSFIPNSGTSPVVPAANGSVTWQGTGSITTVGGTNSVTPQLTGLTSHAVLVGAGTATITKVGPTATAGQVLQSAGSSADPAFSTATYPATTTVSQLLYSSSTNVVSGLATANSAQLVTNSTGVPAWSGTMTNGQVIIGSTGATPTAATLTAGTGVSIANGAASITITASDSYSWIDVQPGTVVTNLEVDTGYSINSGASLRVLPLPTTAAVGNWIQIDGNSTGLWEVTQNASQVIHIINTSTTVGTGGSITSTAQWASVKLRCVVANNEWVVESGAFASLTVV